ncbi:MAG: TRAP transporter substrate-binding protein [Sedimentisphaerales bacterium]|nr:TRAP transporter substrate-binding protein [Sedimentisphaerales bacterium]
MDKKSVSYFIVGLAVGILISVCGFAWYVRSVNLSGGGDKKQTMLKLSHGLDQSHPVHKGMLFMAQRLDELSAGTVKLEIYPNGQLGSETDNIEQLQRGALAMTKVSTAAMESFIPEMAVFSLPYVFRDHEHYWKVLGGPIGKELLLKGDNEKIKLRGLCYYDAGSRNFYTTNKPIMSPDDLAGMKIRVMNSKTSMDMISAMGGKPTPISWGELYTALQQNMVDGAENNPPSYYTNRHFEVCKFFTMDEHTSIPDMLLISSKVWDELPQQVQQWVQQAADDSSVHQRKLWEEKTKESLEASKKEGVEVFYPDKKSFVEKVQPMLNSYKGTAVGELLDRIREVK